MLEWSQALVLSVVQGLTEFLPVSSSAHLILLPRLLGWVDQGLGFDISVHVGTLLALLCYFRTDLNSLARGLGHALRYRCQNDETRLILKLALASLPVGLLGYLAKTYIAEYGRNPGLIALSTLCFGLLLAYSDKRPHQQDLRQLSYAKAGLIGLGQMLALIPGTSRSGVTLSVALLCGVSRVEAARFSFLLSLPVLFAAGSLECFHLSSQPMAAPWTLLAFSALISFITGFGVIHLFLSLIDKIGLQIFAYYRIVLSLFLAWQFKLLPFLG